MNRFIANLTSIFIIHIGMLYAIQARAQSDEARLEKACPAAFAERARLRAKKPATKHATMFTRPALRKELLEMAQQDQAARELFLGAGNATAGALPIDDPSRLAVKHVDDINLPKLKHIIAQEGLPTITMVGLDGLQAAFILIQHADSDVAFQARMLTVISARLNGGGINGNEYALLTDRVLLAQNKRQRYGTQFVGDTNQMKPRPIEDEGRVDQRRHALGLISLANYSCIMHAIYAREETQKSAR